MLHRLTLLIILILFTSNIYSYSLMNGRSHSELDWKEIESENTIIVYHDPLREDALKAISIAEESFKQLSKTYNIKLEDKVRIFISDQDDIINGYFLLNHISIWIDQNDFVNYFTGREKWLRKVISHEMSHYFMYSKIKDWTNFFLPLTNLNFPSTFSEGYAMLFSGEKWEAGRSDSYLRKGVFANDISLKTTPGYFYTTGFSMIRYLHTFYGEEKLIKLLEYRTTFKTYSFDAAFKKVYDKKFKDFEDEWRRYIYTYYYGEAYSNRNLISESDSLSSYSINGLQRLKNKWFSINKFIQNGKSVVILGKKNEDQQYFNLSYGKMKIDSLEIGKLSTEDFISEDIDNTSNLNISKNGKYIIYSRYNRAEYGSFRKILFLLDTEKSEVKEIGRGELSVVSNSGEVYYHVYKDDTSKINYYKEDTKMSETLISFKKDTQIGNLTYNEEKDLLVYSKFTSDKQFYLDIFHLKKNKILKSIKTNYIVKEIIWNKNKEILFSTESGKDFKNRIFTVDLNSYELTEYNSPIFNIRPISIILKDENNLKLLTYGDIYRKNNPIGIVDLNKKISDLEKIPSEKVEKNFYTKWITTKNKNEIIDNPQLPQIISENSYNSFKTIFPFFILPLPGEDGVTLSTLFMEPLGKHTIIFAAYAPYDFNIDKSYYTINYLNKTFYPELNFMFSQYKWFMGINDSKLYYQDIKEGSFNMNLPVNYLNKSFWSLDYSVGFNYKDLTSSDKSSDSLFIYDNGTKTEITTDIHLNYNLPYKNSNVHPIKKIDLTYSLLASTKDIGMEHNFVHHDINLEIGYAPFYSLSSIDNFSLISKLKYEWTNGKDIIQDMPGIDNAKNIPIDEMFNNKSFLRGNTKTINGEKLVSNSNEIWLKIPKILPVNYLGFGGFIDYSVIESNEVKTEIKTFGWETKAIIDLFGVLTVHRFGNAYDLDSHTKLGFYYQAQIILDI